MAGHALCGLISGIGESLVVVLVVGLVTRSRRAASLRRRPEYELTVLS